MPGQDTDTLFTYWEEFNRSTGFDTSLVKAISIAFYAGALSHDMLIRTIAASEDSVEIINRLNNVHDELLAFIGNARVRSNKDLH